MFRATYRAVISKVTCLLNYIEKKPGWGQVGDSQCWSYTVGILSRDSRGKKSPMFKKHLVPVAALGNNFISFIKCGPGVSQGDVRLLHQTEVADPHPPTVRWRKAEDGPVLIVFGLLILQLRDVT